MPRHQREGLSGTDGFSGGSFDIRNVDFKASFSSVSDGSGDADENYEAFLNSWERSSSRFLENTFRNSATSQDDMAVPSRKSREKAKKHDKKEKSKRKKETRKFSLKATDDSTIGNYVVAKPKLPPAKKSSEKRYLLENQGDSLHVTLKGDMSGSLTDKLGRNLVMNQNKTTKRRRASAAVLTSSKDDSGENSRSRSRSPAGRKERSNSTGSRNRTEDHKKQGHKEDHRSGHRHGEQKREADHNHKPKSKNAASGEHHHHKTKSNHPRNNASGEHHLRANTPKTDEGNRRHKHKTPSPDDLSRRNKQKTASPDDKSGRSHHKHEHSRHHGEGKSPEGHKQRSMDRDGSSPTAHKGDHRSRRKEESTGHERGEERQVRVKRSNSLPHDKKEHRRHRHHHVNERQTRRSTEQHEHIKRRSKSHSPRTRHARPSSRDGNRRRRGRQSANPPPPAEPPKAPEPPALVPRRTRGSMILMQEVPNSALAANKLKAQLDEKSQHRNTKHMREGHSGEKRSHHPRPGHHQDSKTPPSEHHRTERKPRPKLKRFKSKSTGHLPVKRPSTSKRGSTSRRNKKESSRSNHAGSKAKERSRHSPSREDRVAALVNAKASSLRNLKAARLAAQQQEDNNSGRGASPGPFRRRASIGDRRQAGNKSHSRWNLGLTNQDTGSKSIRFKEALSKEEEGSMELEELEEFAPRPAVKRHSSLSRLETKSRKSMFLHPQNLGRSRMAFLDDDFSFSDSEEDSDDDSSRQMGQDRLARSIQSRLVSSDLSLEFDVTDTTQQSHPHRMTDNLDHIDLTALRKSQVQEVLARARAVAYHD